MLNIYKKLYYEGLENFHVLNEKPSNFFVSSQVNKFRMTLQEVIWNFTEISSDVYKKICHPPSLGNWENFHSSTDRLLEIFIFVSTSQILITRIFQKLYNSL